jgi:hypothetical protein
MLFAVATPTAATADPQQTFLPIVIDESRVKDIESRLLANLRHADAQVVEAFLNTLEQEEQAKAKAAKPPEKK